MERGIFYAGGLTWTYRGDEIQVERLLFVTQDSGLGSWIRHTVDPEDFIKKIRESCRGLSEPCITVVYHDATQSTGVGVIGWQLMTDGEKRMRDEYLAQEAAREDARRIRVAQAERERLRELLARHPDEVEKLGWKKQ